VTFLRSHLNEEGYILYRWLRLRWSRRRRRDDLIMAAKRQRLAKLKQLKADAMAGNAAPTRTIESQTEALRRVGLLPGGDNRARISDLGRLVGKPRR
jgi:hypothetical protein